MRAPAGRGTAGRRGGRDPRLRRPRPGRAVLTAGGPSEGEAATTARWRPSTGLPTLDGATYTVAQTFRTLLADPAGIRVAEQDNLALPPGESEADVPAATDHALVFVLVSRGQRWSARVGGRAHDLPVPADTAFLVPAGADARWRSRTGASRVLHLHLDPDWTDALAREVGTSLPAAALAAGPVPSDPRLALAVRRLRAVLADDPTPDRMMAEEAATATGAALVRTLGEAAARAARPYALSPARMRRVKDFIEDNLDRDPGLAAVAAVAALSPYHFARAFRADTGLSPHAFLVRRRCERAKRLMAETRMSLAEIAAACGFAHQSHFTNSFRREVGMPPGRWRDAAT